MHLESEAVLWFVIGVAIVLLAELAIALLVLRRKPRARKALLGHAFLLLAMACTAYLLLNRRVAPDGGTYNGSGLLALTGIFWFAAECFVIGALTEEQEK